jgi:hypothetical protein
MPSAPLTPVERLRADILAEQEWRREWLSKTSIEKLCEEPAVEPEDEKCVVPTTPNPNASLE